MILSPLWRRAAAISEFPYSLAEGEDFQLLETEPRPHFNLSYVLLSSELPTAVPAY